jgi:hypothetical protein
MKAINIGIIAFFIILALFLVWQLNNIDIFSTGKPVKKISTHQIVLEKIEELGKLELVKYKFRDVVEHEIEYKNWYRNSKIVLIANGEAVGCIDLKKIKTTDIDVKQGDSLIIYLPEPELCYYKLDHDKTRIYDSSHGATDAAQIMAEGYKEAEKKMKEAALESGILEQTRKNAEIMLKPLLQTIAGKKVMFRYGKVEEKPKSKK